MKYKRAHVDLESYSEEDLTVYGIDRYSKHSSTEFTVMSYSFDEGPLHFWWPGLPTPQDLFDHIRSGGEFWAHNATFEWYMWNFCAVKKYGSPVLRLSQLYCTMSLANAMGLMSSLDQAAACAGLEVRKDKEGYRVMIATCKPRADGSRFTRENNPEMFEKLDTYCGQDVLVEKALSKRLAPLSEKEREIWLLDQKINYRGFAIDVSSAQRLDALVEIDKVKLAAEFQKVTDYFVPTPASHAKFKQWLEKKGVITESIAKDAITKLLDEDDLSPIPMPDEARKAILIRREASKSSNAKIKMMLNLQNNGVVRNTMEYYGAKQTGRWAGRKIQPHNFPRGSLKFSAIVDVMERLKKPNAMQEIEMLHGDISQVASSCLRSLIVPRPGHRFIVADWSNIEGRGLSWLAGEEWKLQAFRDFDLDPKKYPDLYKLTYARAYKIPVANVDDLMRQIGKTMELAFGYQGSVGSFVVMAKTLGVKLPESTIKELVELWRASHPKIKNYWYAVEEAAINAILHPGTSFAVGNGPRQVVYKKNGSFLCCRLPSGRVMYYPYPKYEETDAPWGGKKMSVTYMYKDGLSGKWTRGPTYGGSLTENNSQGLCRDVLAWGMLRVEAAGYNVVLHVHDEIVCEVPIGSHHSVKELESLMAVVPEWATGFPIVAKGYEELRYKKA